MVFDILLDPNGFLERRADDPSLVGPVLVVAIVGIVAATSSYLTVQKVAGSFGDGVGSFVAIGGAIGALSAVFVTFVMWALFAGIFHAISALFDGDGGFRTTLALVGWGYVPSIFSGAISAAALFLALQQLTAPTDPASAATFQQQLSSHSLIITSSALGLVFTLWQGFIWTFAVKHARKLDLREAVLTVAGPVALSILWSGYNLL